MRKEDCFYLGHISRKHGYKGEVIAVFDTDNNEKYRNLESILVDDHQELVPFFIDDLAQNSKGHFILKLEDTDTEEEAMKLIGKKLYLPLDLLPKLEGKSFYFHEVIDFEVIDEEKGPIGHCKGIIDQTSQPLFRIQKGEIEILVPAIDEFIKHLDRENKELHLKAPEGLIDLYLEGET